MSREIHPLAPRLVGQVQTTNQLAARLKSRVNLSLSSFISIRDQSSII